MCLEMIRNSKKKKEIYKENEPSKVFLFIMRFVEIYSAINIKSEINTKKKNLKQNTN